MEEELVLIFIDDDSSALREVFILIVCKVQVRVGHIGIFWHIVFLTLPWRQDLQGRHIFRNLDGIQVEHVLVILRLATRHMSLAL